MRGLESYKETWNIKNFDFIVINLKLQIKSAAQRALTTSGVEMEATKVELGTTFNLFFCYFVDALSRQTSSLDVTN